MEKQFNIGLKTDRNNEYLISFVYDDCSIVIEANQENDIIKKSFYNKFTFEEIQKKCGYFILFSSIKDIFEELKLRLEKEKISIQETETNMKIIIPLPVHNFKEIIFDLNQKSLNENEKIFNLTQLILNQNKEINELKNENIKLKDEINKLRDEDKNLTNEINIIKKKINLLYKVKEEKKKIDNLNSKIINENEEYYNINLKKWINPSENIRAELLYRLSENGDSISTFHKLCDKKGPTLTIFHLDDNNKFGIYTPLSWDSSLNDRKDDLETFIFHLNKERKFNKSNIFGSIYCQDNYGPYTYYLGCNSSCKSMRQIYIDLDNMKSYYENCTNFLSCKNGEILNLKEVEVFKIIIE